MKILVLNSGSSSVKYQLFDMESKKTICGGLIEKIGDPQSLVNYTKDEEINYKAKIPLKDHKEGLQEVVRLLTDEKIGVISNADEIEGVGHRVVHGGETFHSPTIINDEVISAIQKMIPLAPLHNPANLQGIEVSCEIFKRAKQVAVFDTAFHQSMPAYAYRYALPKDLYSKYGLRRYGFHGTSHLYVSHEAADHLGKRPEDINLITVHLGNGCSITAIKGGKSIDTSMGMTPLEGLIMGTRSGDIDPAIPFFLSGHGKMSMDEIDLLLNKRSGLKGICGSNDLRDIIKNEQGGDTDSKLAMEMYTYRIKKYIGAYYAALGSVDAIVFTAGVGENAANIRKYSCLGLDSLGIKLDPEKNKLRDPGVLEIQTEDSKVKILVVHTNEELEIANESLKIINES